MDFHKILKPGDIVRLRGGLLDTINKVEFDFTYPIVGANNSWTKEGRYNTDVENSRQDIVEIVITAKQLKKIKDETQAVDIDAGYEAFMNGKQEFYKWLNS
jgi:preprotein translocase subunit YajC